MIRPIRIRGGLAFVPLTQGKVAVIDVADIPLVEGFNWYAAKNRNTFYAQRAEAGSVVMMHRVILNAPEGSEVDHRNHNGLDNRRSTNIRLATKSQNQINVAARHNSTGQKGVHYVAEKKRWVATIRIDGARRYLGMYPSPELAGAAYAQAALDVHADFRNVR